jgi:hypothetical protein
VIGIPGQRMDYKGYVKIRMFGTLASRNSSIELRIFKQSVSPSGL